MFTELFWRTGHLKPADFSTLKFQVPIVQLSYDLVSDDIFGSENHLEERIKEIWSFFNLQTGRYASNFSKLSILDVDTQDFGYLSIFESESHLEERIKNIWSLFYLVVLGFGCEAVKFKYWTDSTLDVIKKILRDSYELWLYNF